MEELCRQLKATPEQNRREVEASERRRDALGRDLSEGNRHERRKAAAAERALAKTSA